MTAAPKLAKIKLVIAYHGGAYQGWQVQKTGTGVQQLIETAIHKIFPSASSLHGSSRTDTGVHARGMVAHFELPHLKMAIEKVALALNAHLPPDIRIMSAKRAPASFHARFSATGKEYRYYVWNHSAMDPLLRDRAWHVTKSLHFDEMVRAAGELVGTLDFKAFAGNRKYEPETTIRTVSQCKIKKDGELLTFIIRGDGFLYKMCRGIVGTLIQVGEGKIEASEISAILKTRDRRVAGMTAPAAGLILWKVFYK